MKLKQAKITFVVIGLLFMLGSIGCETTPMSGQKNKLDRQGLVDLMEKYINALPTHDPGDLPFAKDVKFTENSADAVEVLEVGQGLWENATGGPTEFKIYAADPVLQSAICLTLIKEKDEDVMFAARIKLKNGKIFEAEHLVIRGGSMGGQPFGTMDTLKKARPGFAEDIPEDEQMTREDLLRIGLSYYDALTSEDGSRAPFSKECERRENGMTTAGPKKAAASGGMPTGGFGGLAMDAKEQLDSGFFNYITEIKPRMVVADVQKGISVGFSMFRHDGTKRLPKDAAPETDNSTQWGKFNLAALHIYKIRNGELFEIEAPGAMLPYGAKSQWEVDEKVYPISD